MIKKLRQFKYRNQAVVFITLFLLHAVVSFSLRVLTQVTGMDEFGTIAGGAYFAGYDWSGVLTQTPLYYGFGFSVLWAPFFVFSSRPFILYHLILLSNSALIGLSGILCYNLVTRYYGLEKSLYAVFVSLASVGFFKVLLGANSADNETVLVFLIWALLYVLSALMECHDNRRKRLLLTFVLSFILIYSYFVHTRAIIFVGAVVVSIVGIFIYYKRWLVNLPVFILLAGAGYFISDILIRNYQATIWKLAENPQLVLLNTSEFTYGQLMDVPFLLFTVENGFKGFIIALVGRLFSIFTTSGGLACLGLVACFFILFTRREKQISLSKIADRANSGVALDTMRAGVLFILSAFGVCYGLMALSTIPSTSAIAQDPAHIKWVTYIRYHANLVGPLVAFFLVYARKYKQYRKIVVKISTGLFVGVLLVFIYWLAPLYQNIPVATYSGEMYNYVALAFLRYSDSYNVASFLYVALFAYIVFQVFRWLLRSKRFTIMALVSFLFSAYIFIYTTAAVYVPNSQNMLARFEATATAVKQAKAQNADLPDTIYLYTSQAITTYAAQFMLADIPLTPILNENGQTSLYDILEMEEFILFADRPVNLLWGDLLDEEGVRLAVMDDNELLYLRGESYTHLLSELGYTIEDEVPQYIYSLPGQRVYTHSEPLGSGKSVSISPLVLQSDFSQNNGAIISDGAPGYLAHGPGMNLWEGIYEVQITLLLHSYTNYSVGSLTTALMNGTEVLSHEKLTSSLFDKDNSYTYSAVIPIQASLPVDTGNLDEPELLSGWGIYVNSNAGARLQVISIELTRIA